MNVREVYADALLCDNSMASQNMCFGKQTSVSLIAMCGFTVHSALVEWSKAN